MVALKRTHPPRTKGPPPPKQERRGGIETVVGFRIQWNSMEKQERRGGIETVKAICNVLARGLQKQERRGGIETKDRQPSPHRHPQEAGTPWWH